MNNNKRTEQPIHCTRGRDSEQMNCRKCLFFFNRTVIIGYIPLQSIRQFIFSYKDRQNIRACSYKLYGGFYLLQWVRFKSNLLKIKGTTWVKKTGTKSIKQISKHKHSCHSYRVNKVDHSSHTLVLPQTD